MIRKVLKLLAFLLGALVLVIAAIWFFPGILLNDTALRWGSRWLSAQVPHHWDKGTLKARSKNFFEKELYLNLEAPCFEIPEEGVQGCFEKIELTVAGGMPHFKPVLTSLGPITILGKTLSYRPKPSKEEKKEEKKEKTRESRFPFEILSSKLQTVELNLPLIEVRTPDIQSDFKVLLQLTGGEKWVGKLQAKTLKGGPLKFDLGVDVVDKTAEISANVWNPVDPIQKVRLYNCGIALSQTKKAEVFDLSCPMTATMKFPRATDLPYQKLLKTVDTVLETHLEKEGEQIKGKISLYAASLFSGIQDGKTTLEVELGGAVNEAPSQWKYNLNGSVAIQQFKKLVNFFSDTSWSVPEPFFHLDGKITLDVKDEGTFGKWGGTIPATLRTDLKSKSQSFLVEVDTDLKFETNPERPTTLKAVALMKDVRLVLPSIDVRNPPPIFPDTRIHLGDPKKVVSAHPQPSNEASSFEYEILIQTEKQQPVRLVSHLAKSHIPVEMDLKMASNEPFHGSLSLKPFDLDLFRRNAKVEKLKVLIAKNPEQSEVHGRLKVFYTDYTITILLDGLLAKPSIHAFSDPPLPEKQVIAVLLFGRSLDTLDSDQMESVGNTRAALADGAIGLASLYALASTPVESIGYDSVSKVFTAKVRLANGTSMNIGTDLKRVNTLGVRRRLGPHWNINTYLENPFENADRSLTSFLEWNWRY